MTDDFEIRYSNRKTLALQIMPDGRLLVRAPRFTPRKRIEEFIQREEVWVQKTRAKMSALPVYPDDPQEVAVLVEKAWKILPAKVALYAAKMRLFPSSVRIGRARTRYGCCSSEKRIVFSCYLMLFPEEAIDYVVVHELAHLRYMNHGKAFYRLVGSILPDYKERRKLLKGGNAEK